MQYSVDSLREALQLWLAAGEKINYSVQDNDILRAIGFRPDEASCDDSREKFTPAHTPAAVQNWLRRRPFKYSRKYRCFFVKKPCIRCMVLHAFYRH